MSYDEQIGERFKHVREVLSMSQNNVASKLNVTRQTLANYESGRTPMRADVVRSLCEIYCIPPSWALGTIDELHIKRSVDGRAIELVETSPSIKSPLWEDA